MLREKGDWPMMQRHVSARARGEMKHLIKYAAMASGTSGAVNFSTDPGQTCLYVEDLANGTIYILNRENLHELDRIGRPGRQIGEFHWVHVVSIDSQGNLYTGEVDTGQRIQKFLRYGEETGCSGTGSADVGLYSLNR